LALATLLQLTAPTGASGFKLRQTVTTTLRRIASDRATSRAASKEFAALDTRDDRIILSKVGIAIATRIALIVITTSISINVKPRERMQIRLSAKELSEPWRT